MLFSGLAADLESDEGAIVTVQPSGMAGDTVWVTVDGGTTLHAARSIGLPLPLVVADGPFVDSLHGWIAAAQKCPFNMYCSIVVEQLRIYEKYALRRCL